MAKTTADALDVYRSKRDPARTPEPVPRRGGRGRGRNRGDTFVIQEHHATALHWDFRLERDGVLVSWAVPKGLPTDPETNHLAVHTEDHPLDYATFEGEIPAGEYGGGAVSIWDRGTYECESWTEREVKVVLHGERVSGRYVLFRTDRSGAKRGDNDRQGRDWMIHRMDPAPEGFQPLPQLVRPMLAVLRMQPPRDDAAYGYEFKWDGVRAMVYVLGGRQRVLSRNDRDVTASYPELRALAESLGSRQVVLDGEIVAMDTHGRPSFERLQSRMHVTGSAQVRRLMKQTPVTFLAFDVLHLDGRSLLEERYDERRRILESLELAGPSWQTPPHFRGDQFAGDAGEPVGPAVLAASKQQGLEGIIAKRLDSRYYPGKRSDCWLKVKNLRTQEVVIGGWKPGEGRRKGAIGSLLLGVPGPDGLDYVGHVGTGFTAAMLRDLEADLAPLATGDSPFATPVPRPHARDAHWVQPQIVGEVAFGEWTREGRLRHPAWRGLRPDKSADDVVRES
ncbi:MAG TPA: non-homologous end-joining DNA ligase [Mycobacteriales bacterium]|nr:non-homologous end-joining DNA ligase [Mycobacteriales bacterium]